MWLDLFLQHGGGPTDLENYSLSMSMLTIGPSCRSS